MNSETRQQLMDNIINMENELKYRVNAQAERLLASPDVLGSLKCQLSDWKELVNPITRGTRLDSLQDLQDAHIIARNIMKQVDWHLNELLPK